MYIDEKEFKEQFQIAVRSILVIFALFILQKLAGVLPGGSRQLGRLRLSDYVSITMSVIIFAWLIRGYKPIKAVLTFYLATAIKAGKIPGREKYLDNVLRIAGRLVLLTYLVFGYAFFMPTVVRVNFAFLEIQDLPTFVEVVALLFGVFILVMIWRDFQPLIEMVTGRITETVTQASSGVAYVNCPSCGTKNDRDSAFCISCGSKASLGEVQGASKNFCPDCGVENLPSSGFCRKCGAKLGSS